MKKWENHLILKNYSNKIRNAKPNVKLPKPSTSSKLPGDTKPQTSSKYMKSQQEAKKTRMLESAGSNKSSISDYYEFEKYDLSNIPLYRLLKIHNLQQYAKELISRGFGYDLQRFMFLSKKDIETLINEIKVLPGHKTKLLKLLDYINSLFISNDYKPQTLTLKAPPKGNANDKTSNITNIYLKSKSAGSLIRKKNFQRQNSKDDTNKQQNKIKSFAKVPPYKLENIGCDFFKDSVDPNDEFSKALEKILSKYQYNSKKTQNKSHSPPKLMDHQNYQKSKILAKPHTIAMDHELMTAPKSRLLMNLKKAITNTSSTPNKKDLFDLGIEYNQIKNLYISFDSGKLTSTLINLDIEEMTYCLACVILKFIEYAENKGSFPFISKPDTQTKENFELPLKLNHEKNQELMRTNAEYLKFREKAQEKFMEDSRNFDLSDKIEESSNRLEERIKQIDKYQSKIAENDSQYEEYEEEIIKEEEKPNIEINIKKPMEPEDQDEIEFEQSKKEIESILKESLLISHGENIYSKQELRPNFKNTANFKQYEQDSIQEEDKIYYDSQKDNENSESFYYNNSQLEENSKVNVSLCSKITYMDENMQNELSFSKDLELIFERAFNEKSNEKWITAKPNKDTISNFCKNIIITSKMEKEVTIICLIYIEKLILKSGLHLTPLNWRRIVFIALILASKLWDDESYENDNFAQAFPQYTTKEINSIEMVFLQFINFELYITSSDYAKYYFILRTFAEKNKKSFPLRALDINTIMSLQNNSNNAQKTLKEMYLQSLNKTF